MSHKFDFSFKKYVPTKSIYIFCNIVQFNGVLLGLLGNGAHIDIRADQWPHINRFIGIHGWKKPKNALMVLFAKIIASDADER